MRRARCGAGLRGPRGQRGRRRALRAHGGAASPPTAARCRQRRGRGARSGPLSGAPGAPIRCAAPAPQLGPVPRAPSHEYPVSPSRGRPVSTRAFSVPFQGGPRAAAAGWGGLGTMPGLGVGTNRQQGWQQSEFQIHGSRKWGAMGSSAWCECSKQSGDTGGGSMGCGKKSYGRAGTGGLGSHHVAVHSQHGHPMPWARLFWGTWHHACLS